MNREAVNACSNCKNCGSAVTEQPTAFPSPIRASLRPTASSTPSTAVFNSEPSQDDQGLSQFSAITQDFVQVERRNKMATLLTILKKYGQSKDLQVSKQKTPVFVAGKTMADTLGVFISEAGIPTTTTHGDREQPQSAGVPSRYESPNRSINTAIPAMDDVYADETLYETRQRSRIKQLQDERVHIQKKTFTKWCNSFLNRARLEVVDLFADLSDGVLLMKLLEIISGEKLGDPNRGTTRVQKIDNLKRSIDFLKKKKIQLENIGAEDILDGNERLILGLIWTIILRFPVIDVGEEETGERKNAKDALISCQCKTACYTGVKAKQVVAQDEAAVREEAGAADYNPDEWVNCDSRIDWSRMMSEANAVTNVLPAMDGVWEGGEVYAEPQVEWAGDIGAGWKERSGDVWLGGETSAEPEFNWSGFVGAGWRKAKQVVPDWMATLDRAHYMREENIGDYTWSETSFSENMSFGGGFVSESVVAQDGRDNGARWSSCPRKTARYTGVKAKQVVSDWLATLDHYMPAAHRHYMPAAHRIGWNIAYRPMSDGVWEGGKVYAEPEVEWAGEIGGGWRKEGPKHKRNQKFNQAVITQDSQVEWAGEIGAGWRKDGPKFTTWGGRSCA